MPILKSPHRFLYIEEIGHVTPLGMQTGVWPKKTVPDILREPLFGQPTPTEVEIARYGSSNAVPLMKTYAVLDAAKAPYLLTDLIGRTNCQFQSLFQGDSGEELSDHSPYLIELKEECKLTRQLMTGPKGIGGLWDKELGIYIRSRSNFTTLRRHFRKFTKIQDKTGKWYFFRFWEKRVTRALTQLTERSALRFLTINGATVQILPADCSYAIRPRDDDNSLLNYINSPSTEDFIADIFPLLQMDAKQERFAKISCDFCDDKSTQSLIKGILDDLYLAGYKNESQLISLINADRHRHWIRLKAIDLKSHRYETYESFVQLIREIEEPRGGKQQYR